MDAKEPAMAEYSLCRNKCSDALNDQQSATRKSGSVAPDADGKRLQPTSIAVSDSTRAVIGVTSVACKGHLRHWVAGKMIEYLVP